ncbi:MAG TPA: hypothetical protein VFX49_12580 [Chloroflexota bacterium]|nr:hypothetical protein [Chloroflexota bacterium]
MSDVTTTATQTDGAPKRRRIPLGQVIYDDLFLWIFLSLVLSLVVYNAWGLMDLVRNPVLN